MVNKRGKADHFIMLTWMVLTADMARAHGMPSQFTDQFNLILKRNLMDMSGLFNS